MSLPPSVALDSMDDAPAAMEPVEIGDLRHAIETLGDVAWIVDPSRDVVLAVSEGYERLWGCRRDDLLRDASAWLAQVSPPFRDAARAALMGDAGTPVTFPIQCRAGVHWVRARATPLPDGRQLIVGSDVSDLYWQAGDAAAELQRVQATLGGVERALQHATDALARETATRQEAERLLLHAEKLEVLGRLTPGIAHDFNNVLAVVSGTLHLLQVTSADERERALIARGVRAIATAASLVRDLHAFAANQEGGGRPLDPRRALGEMEHLVRQAVGARVQLETRCATTGWLVADPHQLQMAVLNLAINARDAMPDGGRLEIEIDEETVDGRPCIVLRVRDAGTGMTPEQLNRALEPFFTTKEPGQGTGLGLPMVAHFVRTAGGTLSLASEAGQGTTVTLALPRIDPVASDGGTPHAEGVDRTRHGDAVVLVVEDDPLLRPVTAACVRELGYEVHEAADATEALAMSARLPSLGLLLSDVDLPDLDGVALAERVRARHSGAGILFVTAHHAGAPAGGRPVLQKPFTLSELADRILVALGRDGLDAGDVTRHIVHPTLRAFYRRWLDVARLGLPSVSALRDAIDAHRDIAVVARVTGSAPACCTFDLIGARLLATFATHAGAEAQVITSVQAAYDACATSQRPTYEAIRYRLGNDAPVRFERVIVPCSEAGATAVTHLVGLVVFTNMPVLS